MASPLQTRTWWKEGVCYQVWPLSFKDSNGDGMGDIKGVISKLDYLHDLGVDYVWMSPMYASPREDYGYDISDYESVDPAFGTLQDMDDLIAGLRSRGMRLVLDLVVNHTSSHHKWFKESVKSKDNPYSNYYIWQDPKIVDGKKCPPNNWRCYFEPGSAWKYVEARDQYYLHLFLESMPDLNWEDVAVRKAIYDSAIKFWLGRGVSGFRVDVVGLYSKYPGFPNAPVVDHTSEFQTPGIGQVSSGPRMHEFLREQRREALDAYGDDVVMIGELGTCTDENLIAYLSPEHRELDMVFDFAAYDACGLEYQKPWTEWVDRRSLLELRKALTRTQGYMDKGLWPTSYFENHDQPRSTNNFGSRDPQFQSQSSKLLGLLLASMSGTLFIYQGQEIGTRNMPKDWPISDMKDIFWITMLKEAEQQFPDDKQKQKEALEIFQRFSRDNARTPVQWSAEEPYAGFSTAQPWMRINEDFKNGINVQDQLGVPDSVLTFWQQMLKFRKSHAETMIYGDTVFIDNDNENILSVIKRESTQEGEAKRLLVVMNYSDTTRPLPSFQESELSGSINKSVFGTGPGADGTELHPWEGRVFEL